MDDDQRFLREVTNGGVSAREGRLHAHDETASTIDRLLTDVGRGF